MDGPPEYYYVKGNKSDGERQIRYYFTYMWSLKTKINKPTKPETDSWIQRANGWLPEQREVGRWSK